MSHFQLWQIYTKGWGPRAWAHKFWHELLPMFIAMKLPKKVALFTFIRVYAKDGCAPGPEYSSKYDTWMRDDAK